MQASFYRFDDRAAFLAACDAADWREGPEGERLCPAGVTVAEVGAIFSSPSVGANGRPIPGALLDARWHVNVLWDGVEPPAEFAAAAVTPEAPTRTFATPPPPVPAEAPVPQVVPAWKGKAVLSQMGLLPAAEAAAAAASGVLAIAWANAAEWGRDSEMLAGMAGVLNLSPAQVDEMFRAAGAMKG